MMSAAAEHNDMPALVNDPLDIDPSSGPGDDARSQVSMDTHSNEWANPMDDDTTSSWKQQSLVAACSIIKNYGSCYKFIENKLMLDATSDEGRAKSLELQNAHAAWLWEEFPESDQVPYHTDTLLPGVTPSEMGSTTPLVVHITKMGYSKLSSVKPPPGEDVFKSLVERYAIDGFLTQSEPGWCSQPDQLAHLGLDKLPPTSSLNVHSIGCVKFWGRICSLHALLLWCRLNQVDLKTACPILWQTVRDGIYIYHVPQETKVDEALLNCQRSAQGAIRRAPSTTTFICMIYNLQKMAGLTDYMDFVKKWNKQSGTRNAVQGKKATVLKFIYEMGDETMVEEINDHVGRCPEGMSAWSDDNMASKKLFPGWAFGAKSKKWAPRLKVTKESFTMMVRATHSTFEARPLNQRKKPELADQIHMAELAAACYALGQEVFLLMPIKPIVIQNLSFVTTYFVDVTSWGR